MTYQSTESPAANVLMEQQMPTREFTFLTQNVGLGNGIRPPAERYERFTYALSQCQPDVVNLQEVDIRIGLRKFERFASQYGYDLRVGAVYPGKEHTQALAILSRLPIRKTELIDTGIYKNKFLAAWLGEIVLINAHPETPPTKEGGRIRKIKRAIGHVAAQGAQDILLAGDLNSIAGVMPLVGRLEQMGFTSAYRHLHGRHDPTYPAVDATELARGRFVKPLELLSLHAVGKIAGLFGKARADGLYSYTLDYMMTRGDLTPVAAKVFGPDMTDEPYADHWGLWGKFATSRDIL